MSNSDDKKLSSLRQRAEKLLASKGKEFDPQVDSKIQKFVYDLNVHQIELEMQNEELQRSYQALKDSREDYMRLYHDAPVGFIVLNATGIIHKANRTFSIMIDAPDRNIEGTAFTDFLESEDRQIFLSRIKPFFRNPSRKRIDVRLLSRTTSKFVSLEAISYQHAEGGSDRFEELLVAVIDVTDRKRYETALKSKQEELEQVLSSVPDGFMVLDRKLKIRYFNSGAQKMVSKSQGEVVGKNLLSVFPEIKGSIFEEKYQTALASNIPIHFEAYLPNAPYADWWEVSAHPFNHGLNIYFRIITERKRAQKLLEESESRFRSYVENSPFGIFITDINGNYIRVNQEAVSMTGYTEEQLLRMNVADLVAPQYVEEGRAHFSNLLEWGSSKGEVRFLHREGDIRWLYISAVKLSENRLLGFAEDVTGKKRGEKALAQSEMALRLNHSIATIFITESEEEVFSQVLKLLLDSFSCQAGYFGYINDQGDLVCPAITEELGGSSEEKNKSHIFSQDSLSGIWRESLFDQTVIIKNESVDFPGMSVPLKNAVALPILQKQRCIGQITLCNKSSSFTEDDIDLLTNVGEQTAPILQALLKKQEQQRLQKEVNNITIKLEKSKSLNRMAGAIAHNYNNLLNVILGNIELVLSDMRSGKEASEDQLCDVLEAAQRLSKLGKNMITYLGQGNTRLQTVDLSTAVPDILKNLANLLPAHISLSTNKDDRKMIISIDRNLLASALENLLENACDAIGEKPGSIAITVRIIRATGLNHDSVYHPPGWTPERESYACIELQDSGCGMSPATMGSLFDPFYSEKFTGRGMGLATVAGIAKIHSGAVAVHSIPSKGSVFSLYLPLDDSGDHQS